MPGGLGPKTFIAYARNYGVELTLEEAAPLCKLWKDTFPETWKYLEDPGPELDELAPPILFTDTEEERKYKNNHKYKCVTLTGRKRARCSYTQACNTGFQALSSDCTKVAMWNLFKSGYKMINMIHDETISLLPFDEHLTERTAHIQEIMVNSMRQLTPDVKVKAEPAVMFRWAKSAEPYFYNKQIIPWELVPKLDDHGKVSIIEPQDLTPSQAMDLEDRMNRLLEQCARARQTGGTL